ncbi:MAG: aspartate/glutamate racemase family protein [Granulosicoccus sp.]
MTRLLFINPNTTQSMTDKVLLAARASVGSEIHVDAATSPHGPASIQGPEDGDAAVPGLLDALKAGIKENYDGYAIACFDDTGLDQCRELTDKPVVGIGQAAFHASMLLRPNFSVVTTLAVSIPVIESNLTSYGLSSACVKVRASDVPVLALEEPGSQAEQQISEEIALAIRDDKCCAIVLGCAGMAPLASRLSAQHGIPVIDGVVAAAGLLTTLHKVSSSG